MCKHILNGKLEMRSIISEVKKKLLWSGGVAQEIESLEFKPQSHQKKKKKKKK
jgi:hypothetical protein